MTNLSLAHSAGEKVLKYYDIAMGRLLTILPHVMTAFRVVDMAI